MQPPATYNNLYTPRCHPCHSHRIAPKWWTPMCFSLHLKAPKLENLRIAHNPSKSYWNRCKNAMAISTSPSLHILTIKILKNQSALLSINQGSNKGIQHCVKFEGHPGRDWCMTQGEGDLSDSSTGGKNAKVWHPPNDKPLIGGFNPFETY